MSSRGAAHHARTARGRSKFEAVTFERGVTHDPEFEQWANKVWDVGPGQARRSPPEDVRKDILIEVYDEAGHLALAYEAFRCWVSEYEALPDLDANANAVAVQHLKLENEGIEREDDIPKPADPSCIEP